VYMFLERRRRREHISNTLATHRNMLKHISNTLATP
jgi:hypothetical protein